MSLLTKLSAMLLLPLLFACTNGNTNNPDPAQLRFTHVSADAPAVNVYIDGEIAFENLEFKQSSGLLEVTDPGTIEVEVRGILPDESEVTVIGPLDISLSSRDRTDILAIGNLFNDEGEISISPRLLDPVIVENDLNNVRVSLLHAAPEVPAVDIYVTAPGDSLSNTTPITASFGDAAGPVAALSVA